MPGKCHYCPEAAEHTCASCDRKVCGDHSSFSPEADEHFCSPLERTSLLMALSVGRCTSSDRIPVMLHATARAEGWDPVRT